MLFFFLTCVVGLWIGRRLGWGLSRAFLYTLPVAVTAVVCVAWGVGIAYLLRATIAWLKPGIFLKVIGFGAGAYVSIPNYGLIAEHTIPQEERHRHLLIQNVPLLGFIVSSVILPFLH